MSEREALIEFNTQDIIGFIVEETGIAIQDAMLRFYNSEIYQKLLDYETGLYKESAAYIYELYKDEYDHGYIVQNEI